MSQHLSQILREIDNSTLALLPCYTISGVNELLCEQWVGRMSKTDLADFFPQTVPKKYPRALGDIPPPHKSAHNDILCTDSKGNQAKQDKPARRSPCRRSSISAGFDVSALCIDRTGRGNNRIHKNAKQYKHKRKTKEGSKEGKAERKPKGNGKAKPKESTSKRACKRAYYFNTSKADHPLYTILYHEKHINR